MNVVTSSLLRRLLTAAGALLTPAVVPAQTTVAPAPAALPTGGRVVQGSGTLQQAGNQLTVQQTSARLVTEWQRFDIGADAAVRFFQPGRDSVALNRVTGTDASRIFGRLDANGQVFLLNPQGVLFGASARVEVGGLVASSLGMSDDDFMAGRVRLGSRGDTAGSVVNDGQLRATEGGYVALVAPRVVNNGGIETPAGSTVLAAGQQATVDFAGTGLLRFSVDAGVLDALVDNRGSLRAEGGSVLLSARAADAVTRAVVNQAGVVDAGSMVTRGGRVLLEADAITLSASSRTSANGASGGGSVLVGGDWQGSNTSADGAGGSIRAARSVTMEAGALVEASASVRGDGGNVVLWSDVHDAGTRTTVAGTLRAEGAGAGGNGGRIETSGATLKVADSTQVSTRGAAAGLWLLDPQDYVIAASAGDITGAALSANLAGSNVTINSSSGAGSGLGNIYVRDTVTWGSDNTLTLSAAKDIVVSKSISSTGTNASLKLLHGGSNGSTAPTAGTELLLSLADNTRIDITGSNAGLTIGNESYTLVNTLAEFQAMSASGRYALGNDLALGGTTYSGALYGTTFTGKLEGLGHVIDGLKIRSSTGANLGVFAQVNGATIRHLGVTNADIQTSSASDTAGQVFRVGALVGNVGGAGTPVSSVTTLDNVFSSGVISSTQGSRNYFYFAGGLAGSQNGGTLKLTRSFSIASVSSGGSNSLNLALGGLIGDVGLNVGLTSHAQATSSQIAMTIDRSYSSGSVVQGTYGNYFGAGGLVGVVFTGGGTITDSFSWANVVGTASWGGIAGYAMSGTYQRLYTTQSQATGSGAFSGTGIYTGSQLASATSNGTALPSGWNSTLWNVGARPTLKILPVPQGLLYVKVVDPQGTSTGSSTYGAFDGTWQIVDAAGVAVNLASLGLAAPTGTAVYTLDNFTAPNVAPAALYSTSYLGGLTLTGANAANYRLNPYSTATSYRIDKAPLTVTANNASIVYSGSPWSGGNGVTYSGFVNNQTASVLGGSLTWGGTAQGKVNVGSYTLVPGGLTSSNYALSFVPGTLTITAAQLTAITAGLTGTVAKTYDGSTTAVLTPQNYVLSGFVGSDGAVVTKTTGSYADANAGSGKLVTVSLAAGDFSASGSTNLANYSLPTSASGNVGSIAPKALTATATAPDKVYDGGTVASPALTLQGLVSGQTLGVSATGSFNSKDVLTAGTVTVTGATLTDGSGGGLATNYTLTAGQTAAARITPRTLNVSFSGIDKVYDGSATATVTASDDRISGDVLAVASTSVSFVDRNVGAGKTITVGGLSLSGTDAANYSVAGSGSAAASITQRTLHASYTAQDKVYDGSSTATVSASDDRVTGDVLSVAPGSASFNGKDVGNGKTVTVAGVTLAGADAGNYVLASSNGSTSASITPLTLQLDIPGASRAYDGSTAITAPAVGLQGVLGSDSVVLGSGSVTGFVDRNVGTNKAVSYTGFVLGGSDASNYMLPGSALSTASITPRTLLVSFTGSGKVYDGSTIASVTATDDRIHGDLLNLSTTGASFADKHVGSNKTITVTGLALSGADAGNYALAAGTGSTTANITPRVLNAGFTGIDKVYDGSAAATVMPNDDRIAGDMLSVLVGGATFADKHVGSAKTINIGGVSIVGTDAGNYTLAATNANSTASITPRTLHVGFTGVDKIYDGSAAAAVTSSDDRVAGDALTVSTADVAFADKHAGSGKAIGVGSVSIAGSDAGNYTLVGSNAGIAARIIPRSLTVSYVASDKVYDGSAVAAVTTSDDRVTGDALTVSTAGATFADKHVGSGKAIAVTGLALSGVDAGNYVLTSTGSTTASITPRVLVVSFTGTDKVYDGTTSATVGSTDNRVAGDALTVSTADAAFADKHVGSSKAVALTGVALSGPDAGNYTLASTGSTTASITPRALVVRWTGADKVYDGNTTATIGSSDNRLAGDVLTVSAAAASFADKNVGSGKVVAVSGLALTGPDSGNYALVSSTGSTTAAIARLASVQWVGGTSGNWFDPANWAGGAVPDLANVAAVMLPAGVNVSFDNGTRRAPAEGGPVFIDRLADGGATLRIMAGSLNVGSGGVTLEQLRVDAGAVNVAGLTTLDRLTVASGTSFSTGTLHLRVDPAAEAAALALQAAERAAAAAAQADRQAQAEAAARAAEAAIRVTAEQAGRAAAEQAARVAAEQAARALADVAAAASARAAEEATALAAAQAAAERAATEAARLAREAQAEARAAAERRAADAAQAAEAAVVLARDAQVAAERAAEAARSTAEAHRRASEAEAEAVQARVMRDALLGDGGVANATAGAVPGTAGAADAGNIVGAPTAASAGPDDTAATAVPLGSRPLGVGFEGDSEALAAGAAQLSFTLRRDDGSVVRFNAALIGDTLVVSSTQPVAAREIAQQRIVSAALAAVQRALGVSADRIAVTRVQR